MLDNDFKKNSMEGGINASALLCMLERPPLYAKTPHPFWDDAHISKGMLKAHLHPEWDAASRNHRFIDASVAWICSLLPPDTYPALLDLGCGPGLYAQRFAKAGYAVSGVDLSARSLEYAQKAASDENLTIRYEQANYLTLEMRQQYDLAVMIYCDYGALSAEDRAQALRAVYKHLRPGGRFLLDVSSMAAYDAFCESQTWSACEQGGDFWSERPYIALERKTRYGENVTLHQAHILTDRGVQTHYIWHTYFSAERLAQEAQQAGFRVLNEWGDVAGAPFDESSPTISFLLEKQS